MASNPPPFAVDDQTDEDFFDKLVDDEDDDNKPDRSLAYSFGGSDSDEAKAFANLSLGEDEGVSVVATRAFADLSIGDDSEVSKKGVVSTGEDDEVAVEEVSTLETSNSSDSVIEHSGREVTEANSDLMIGKGSNSPGSNVKEVQWDAFSADAGKDGGNGFGSYSDFFTELPENAVVQTGKGEDFFNNIPSVGSGFQEVTTNYVENNDFNSVQYQGSASTEASTVAQNADGQVQNNVEYWENQYPGWKFDVNTGQWYQVDGFDTGATTQVQETSTANQGSEWGVSEGNTQISYLQQTTQSVAGAIANSGTTESVSHLNQASHEGGMNESVSSWNKVSQESGGLESVSNWDQFSAANNGYPPNMVFDPQYPGWYYDTNTQEWQSLELYTASVQSAVQAHEPVQSTVQVHESVQSTVQAHVPVQSTVQGHYPVQSTVQAHDMVQSTVQGYYPVQSTVQAHGSVQPTVQTHNPVQSTFQPFNPVQSTFHAHVQPQETVFGSNVAPSHENIQKHVGDYSQVGNYQSQGINIQNQDLNRTGSFSNYNQQNYNMWQPKNVAHSGATQDLSGNSQFQNNFSPKFSATNQVSRHNSFDARETVPFYENVSQNQNDFRTNSSQGFVATSFNQPIAQSFAPHSEQINMSNDYYMNQNSSGSSYTQYQSSHQFSPTSNAGRSSAGRPPHALVTFGFGGKLVVMKENSSLSTSSYGTQVPLGGSVSIYNLMEVVMEKSDPSRTGLGTSDYFSALGKRSFSGPLVGGNVSSKELNKWVDEKVLSLDSPNLDYRKAEVLKLLFSLLKIACQFYGKLRSPFGTEAALRESDSPESAVARLFASAKGNGMEFSNYSALGHCLQKLPSEEQIRAIAEEVQRLLVSGKKKEALQFATDGQLWGPALVLAAQLGDQYYCETVKQMALRQLVAGSPLRTLCLLIAGQPADVFSSDSSASSIPGSVNMFPQPIQHGVDSMLDHWEENLAVITANRTKDDELVLIHLGDSLWKNRSEIMAAHICYLVAEANFEPYSDTARLCLIGADHLKCPRTYASPDAIQRTELYEYSKVLGNSQFILLSFQPYKFMYALMLAEVGKVSESLKYCQSVLKSLKTGRAPEVETLRQVVSSFEERLRTHQQGGYSSNLAPGKIVGKILNLFDSTAHRVVGGLPPLPSTTQSSAQVTEQYYQTMAPRVSTSQSTMAMSSLMPSASTEPINELTTEGSRMSMHNRSVSEPDIGRTPRQDDKGVSSSAAQGKASGGASRFGRFGFGSQIFQKTVGLVLKPRQDKQAKLGETNKFYYDEKLKRWVEEGAEVPAEEAAPPPPPTTAVFQNGTSDYRLKNALKSEGGLSNGSPEFRSPTSSDHSSGIPPIPTSSNQFSARGRMGVRSRYVDTFNKGGANPTNLFQSPTVPPVKPAIGGNPKFFVPSPVPAAQHVHENTKEIVEDTTSVSDISSIHSVNNTFPSPPPSVTMQRFPSMDNITRRRTTENGSGLNSSHSRRTASWSGSLNDASSPPNRTEVKPLGEVLGMPPSLFMPNDHPNVPLTRNMGSFGEDLHEVEL